MHLKRTIASSFLVLVAGPISLRAQNPAIHLTLDQSTQSLLVRSTVPGTVFLVLGPLAVPPIRFGGLELDVVVHHLFPLGQFDGGDHMQFFVPRGISALAAEAILADETFQLHDSNVVSLSDAFADIVAATFRATLTTSGLPPVYTVAASLTAPTPGHEFRVDGFERSEDATHVYLRLIAPGADELLPEVLTDYQLSVVLGAEVGKVVHVVLMRAQRGSVGPEVYRLMASLVPGAR